MPLATPLLRRLRQRTGIKPGLWAEAVEYDRNAYSNVEHGHRPASPEFFARCAALLTEKLGITVDADDLMAARDQAAGSAARGQAADQAEASEATSGEAGAEEAQRGVA